ncbi:hypothetical protein GCM10022243_20470 [Saccharothrix violaceirubra]|uniref:SagB-type dehydrogenase family enzyme n=1 Tax=Saccharothrix violaceirubra TaxID=413306 RepID=A0A7W7T1W6_9PSEU|nr:nitroreductase family protein [Saccharothrix violaceirubra]MBB4965050.1 SagB-type dehydrogenase family enzyme [Saccharothrix violaceirubra]
MIVLPEPGDVPMPLGEALRTRRSRYSYAPLAPDLLSTLLHNALGVQRHQESHVLGMAPNAGGLPSLRVHVVHDGEVYEYLRGPHDLVARGKSDLTGVFAQEEFARRAHTVIVLSGHLGPGLAKYGERHHRTVHLDAGVAVQNLYLVATALGLNGCAVAGFADAAVAALVGAPYPLALFVVGATPRNGHKNRP